MSGKCFFILGILLFGFVLLSGCVAQGTDESDLELCSLV